MGDLRPPAFGLAIMGATHLDRHVAAIESLSRLKLIGRACDEGVSAGDTDRPPGSPLDARTYCSYDDLLADGEIRGVAVCAAPAARLYWIRRSAAAGKHVFSESPIVASYRQGRDLADHCRRCDTCLSVTVEPIYSQLSRVLKEWKHHAHIGRPLYFDLTVCIPKDDLETTRYGVLLLQGIFVMVSLTRHFGRLDSVYARTRSLGQNRAAEDVAVVQLRFLNGLDGTVQINGLGGRHGISFRLYGSDGSAEVNRDLKASTGDDLRGQYESFLAAAEGSVDPTFGSKELADGLFMVEWLTQSARQDREVYQREVQFG